MPIRVDLGDFYGNYSLNVESMGEWLADRYGLETASVVFSCPKVRALELLPLHGSVHPLVPWLTQVRRRVTFGGGLARYHCEYEGCYETSDPVYELRIGTSEEPIETHPYFVSQLAGTPENPKNGAVYLNRRGEIATSWDDEGVYFSHFKTVTSSAGNHNHLAGIETFLDGSKATWVQTFVSNAAVPDIYDVGKRSNPPGGAPVFPGRNWLYNGVSDQIRGTAHFVSREWILSGRQGWHPFIY